MSALLRHAPNPHDNRLPGKPAMGLIGFVVGGRLDWLLGASLGALLTAGTLAGAWLAARLPARRLAQAVGLTLVAAGAWYGYATLQMG